MSNLNAYSYIIIFIRTVCFKLHFPLPNYTNISLHSCSNNNVVHAEFVPHSLIGIISIGIRIGLVHGMVICDHTVGFLNINLIN